MSGQSFAASGPKLAITAPTTAPASAGNVAVRATLKSKRRDRVRVARFYLNGRLVTIDRKFPFAIKPGVKFDTRTLPTAKPYLTLVVTYEWTRPNGKIGKKTVRKSVRVSFTGGGGVNAQSTGPLGPPKHGFPLAASEDFNGTALTESAWNTQRYDSIDEETPGTPALSRPYNYAEGAAYNPNNVSVSDGRLDLRISDEQAPDPSAGDLTRSTGMVNSKGKFAFKYGYVETRAWVPACNGCWPSFWIMPATGDNWPPEIDIFEFFQFSVYSRTFPHSVFHWTPDGPEGDNQFYEHYNSDDAPVPSPKPQEYGVTHPAGDLGNYLDSWHTYGMLWTPNYVEIYIDNKLGARVVGASKIPQEPMYLIYMMAICRVDSTLDPEDIDENGHDTRQCNPDTGTPNAGESMKIDYLRVYSSNT
ncbi:MAG: glycoside hydrolase family 16 protein [Thermoleophilaceae bacterium]|nr:glycoside hydrolase family 16 protein [Thermoleophilaceae bacterium]